jgi:periplasmic copper chaperone A
MISAMLCRLLKKSIQLRAVSLATGCVVLMAMFTPTFAKNHAIGELTISNTWARPTPPGLTVSAFYFVIESRSNQADRLIGHSSTFASRVDLHETRIEGGMARMRPVKALTIPAKGRVKAEPGGLHMMLIGLTRPLTAGQRIPITLKFERAGTITIEAVVADAAPK